MMNRKTMTSFRSEERCYKKGGIEMKKSTRAIAEEMGLQPISILTALKMIMKGYRPGMCWGYRTKKGVRAWRTR